MAHMTLERAAEICAAIEDTELKADMVCFFADFFKLETDGRPMRMFVDMIHAPANLEAEQNDPFVGFLTSGEFHW